MADIRRALHEEVGNGVFDDFNSVRKQIEEIFQKRAGNGDGEEDGESDETGDGTKTKAKALPEKKRKKLLNTATWERDKKLYDAARALRDELGEDLYTDHNRFRDEETGGRIKIEVRLEDETVWLTQRQMADLFQTTKQNIGQYLKNIFQEGELDPNSVVKKFFTTAADGKLYSTNFTISTPSSRLATGSNPRWPARQANRPRSLLSAPVEAILPLRLALTCNFFSDLPKIS